MFKNPFSFNGRIRRLEYGLSYLIYIVFYVGFMVLVEQSQSFNLLGLLFIPMIWFLLAQGAKRCHDKGNNGFYQIIPFYSLLLLFSDGDEGENEYGLNPKGIGNRSELDDIGKEDLK